MTEQQLARALVQAGLVTPQHVQNAAKNRAAGVGIAQALVDLGVVLPANILQIDPQAFERVPGLPPTQVAPPQASTNGRPTAVTAEATRNEAARAETPHIHLPGPTAAMGDDEIEQIGLGRGGAPAMDDSGVVFDGDNRADPDDPVAGAIVIYCNELLRIAISMGASDMHLEPHSNGLLPRYRIDGQLYSGDLLPPDVQAPVLSRFKVLAGLDITENRLPQDGRFRATVGGRLFDFRVSTLPSIYGEKIVLRLLDHSSLVINLTQLGFSGEARASFEQMLTRSYGMILITGPTGSGKTTTLYAALAAARDVTKNVVTVEDPVEYELHGVTQTNVNSEIGLTFATQLRAILRQDPDVILVGEIRDTETAEVSIRAALTGHLLLSTLHTNSAVAAVTRLQDMGIPPFLIASSMSGVIAQRLVRIICRYCREQVPFDSAEYQEASIRLKLPKDMPIFKGRGCEECGGSGTRGRLAIVEVLNVEGDLRRAIMEKQDSDALRKVAVANGMRTLWEDAMDKLARGLTTTDEIARVLLGAQGAED
jgi:type II secretory ATPase GspE/PulE/Tfp pilus assembly ATPase PilB-like protein